MFISGFSVVSVLLIVLVFCVACDFFLIFVYSLYLMSIVSLDCSFDATQDMYKWKHCYSESRKKKTSAMQDQLALYKNYDCSIVLDINWLCTYSTNAFFVCDDAVSGEYWRWTGNASSVLASIKSTIL